MADRDVAPTVTKSGLAAAGPAPDLVPPKHIGRYRIERRLGKGGFGIVYLAYDEQLGRSVALKVPNADLVARSADVELYLNEARVVASLDHAAIVPVHDVGSTADCPFFVVMKYIEGTDLASQIKQGGLARVQTTRLVATIAEALHYAHREGLVHRDVKPGNILIDTAGKPYLVDFGLALRDGKPGQASRYLGTPAYTSPEQARGEGHRVDGRSDVFSLGAVFYELLTGRRAFSGDSRSDLLDDIIRREPKPPRQLDDTIAKELERICLKALAKRASERYTTAKDFAEDLLSFLQVSPDAESATGASPANVATPGKSRPADRPHHSDTSRAMETPDHVGISSGRPNIVPKGLRAFDEQDAEFFLELLPGPRDRLGLPDSLRFWKTRIEESDVDRTFSVGLIYGPSGCGKSSFVKAGLLPRLSESVATVYVEAAPDDTERRLLAALHKVAGPREPAPPSDASPANIADALRAPCAEAELEPSGLPDAIARLRRDGIPARSCGKADGARSALANEKVLIVVDQFEQWLHARRELEAGELIGALRQCDGRHVQCIVLVRDDFWLAVSRFMIALEVDLVPGKNIALVDLFDLDHAQRVLAAYGVAFGKLPQKRSEQSKEQTSFINQAVRGLAEDGKVVCVRLALFAEMMKDKAWTPATLKHVGGTAGVGIAFLEETFCSPRANPQHRLHQQGARSVLKALLPESTCEIRGRMQSYDELLRASGYSRRREFDDLLRILDGELRLITPVDVEQSSEEPSHGPTTRRWFQLTHDYLVPSLRDWLTRKQRETWRGRAELRLAERSAEWNVRPENRHLPALWEYFDIQLFARCDRTDAQCKMMRKATQVHGLRALGAATVVGLCLFLVMAFSHRVTDWELFSDVTRPAPQRLRAFDHLHATDDEATFAGLVRMLEGERDEELLAAVVTRVDLEAMQDTDDGDDQRAAWMGLLRRLLADKRRTTRVRLAAFDALRAVSTDAEVLDIVRTQIDNATDGELAERMLSSIDAMQLNTAKGGHEELARRLIDTIVGAANQEIVKRCVERFNKLPPGQLCDLLLAAYRDSGQNLAATEGLGPYVRHVDPERVEEIGRYVERELRRLAVPNTVGEVGTSLKLQYLVQAAGLLQTQSMIRYEDSLEVVAMLLRDRNKFEVSEMLDTLIEGFAALAKRNDSNRYSLAPLRELLAESDDPFVRGAAARALGELGDDEILPALRSLALDDTGDVPINLQKEAVTGLTRLGEHALRRGDRQETVMAILDVFRQLIQRLAPAPLAEKRVDVLLEAIVGFGRLSQPSDGTLLFELLRDPHTFAMAVGAIQTIIANAQGPIQPLIEEFLDWRTQIVASTKLANDPSSVLEEFVLSSESIDTAKTEAAAKATAKALALAQAHGKPAARVLASQLLGTLLADADAPRLDPAADEVTRARQVDEWIQWWTVDAPMFEFTSGHLARRSADATK